MRARLFVEGALAVVGVAVFVTLAVAVERGGQVVAFDDDVARWVVENVPQWASRVARVVTVFGGFVGVALVGGIAAIALWRAARRGDAVFLTLAVGGILLLVPTLKSHFERARPDYGSAIPLPHSYSFPSGHAATAVVLYGALGLLAAERARSRARAAAWLCGAAFVAVAIGASRVVLNVHFASDVAAGLALGLAWICGCAIVRDVVVGREPRRAPG
jgi:membrane-associated phospholipid phosphatase